MAYKKKNLTPEERSAIYRANAMKVKHRSGGRKPSVNKAKPLPVVRVKEEDHAYVDSCAAELGITMGEFFHLVLFRYRLADRSMKSNGREWPVERK